VIPIDIQIHGYRKGHQLLASSIELSKEDQATIDRLSDVAGSLRPKEQFTPYLSAYPLPSGIYYVVAKTWQDLSVARAGCVRTKSLVFNAEVWSKKNQPHSLLNLLNSGEFPTENDAMYTELIENDVKALPTPPTFNASELLEALFLEESKPVVVFDAPEPELITLYLLTALWPNIRRRFAISTFALAPRKIGGRDLDLVFAPSNAKAKFSDWAGRRIDGGAMQIERHRWTRTIVRRVFEDPMPRLLSEQDLMLMGSRDSDSGVSLRIALLWNELFKKLEQTPTAALGLLDIATSGMVNHEEALILLESPLVKAIRNYEDNLYLDDAWEFVGAITRKLCAQDMPASKREVEHLVTYLAGLDPDRVLTFLQQYGQDEAFSSLFPHVAKGLSNAALLPVKSVLINIQSETIIRLMLESIPLISLVIRDEQLIEKIAVAINDVNQELADEFGTMLLPFIVEDRQLPIANLIIGRLNSLEVIAQLNRIGEANAFQAVLLCKGLIDKARNNGEINATRDILVKYGISETTKDLLEITFDPIESDILWLLNETRLSKELVSSILIDILQRADDVQLTTLGSDSVMCERLIANIPEDAVDTLIKVTLNEMLPINLQIRVVRSLLPKLDSPRKLAITECTLRRCLRSRFGEDERAVLFMLLDILGADLDGKSVVKEGFKRNLDADIISRNLIVLEQSSPPIRESIVFDVDEIARILSERNAMDLTEEAYDACALLMLDAQKVLERKKLVHVGGLLVPKLLRARRQPVSSLIAALFPLLYRDLANASDAPELMKLFFFFDWDRCKTARDELVEAFIYSSWRAGDLALIACRCLDIRRILKKVSKSYNGKKYLAQMRDDLARLDDKDRDLVKSIIDELITDKDL